MKIGSFTRKGDKFTGNLETLTVTRKLVIEPIESDNERAPIYRIMSGKADVGAVWERDRKEGDGTYYSVKLDDPGFPEPIYGVLHEVSDGNFILIWERQEQDTGR